MASSTHIHVLNDIHVSAVTWMDPPLKAKEYYIARVYQLFLEIHLSQWVIYNTLGILDKAARKMGLQVYFQHNDLNSFNYIPRHMRAGSMGVPYTTV